MFSIENDILKVSIRPNGAELSSIYNKEQQVEYMWEADPAFWAKQSPVLFPIVGTLKEDSYFFEDKTYHLGRHGFAREMMFTVAAHSKDFISFSLEDNAETLTKFPFHFIFSVTYQLTGNRLGVTYTIKNTGNEKMYFSVGGHPAFKVPLVDGLNYEDYYLEFNQKETAGRWMISKEGLIENSSTPLLNNTNHLPLSKSLFHSDAIVFKHLKSDNILLKSDKDKHGISFDFVGFPFLGIWAAKNANFVCIEPWCGIADSVDTDQQWQNKEGIESLEKDDKWERGWQVSLF